MRISELIVQLRKLNRRYGDLDVFASGRLRHNLLDISWLIDVKEVAVSPEDAPEAVILECAPGHGPRYRPGEKAILGIGG